MKIKIKKLRPDAVVPIYAHPEDVGMDLFSIEDLIIEAGERVMIGTGISIEFPYGYAALIWDKSGYASKNGIKTMGGVIDPEYRGEYKVIILNTSKEDFEVKKGMKIAQVLFTPVVCAEIEEVDSLSDSSRGERGFGSTGG